MKRIPLFLSILALLCSCNGKIDRAALVDRNNPHLTALDPLASLSVGNGRFADNEKDPDFKTRLGILAQIEGKYLELYYCIPMCSSAIPEIMSYKVNYYTDVYNIMYNFGLFRLMQYHYTDAEWAEFVASQGGALHYE